LVQECRSNNEKVQLTVFLIFADAAEAIADVKDDDELNTTSIARRRDELVVAERVL
jgi:hypothetical protein